MMWKKDKLQRRKTKQLCIRKKLRGKRRKSYLCDREGRGKQEIRVFEQKEKMRKIRGKRPICREKKERGKKE